MRDKSRPQCEVDVADQWTNWPSYHRCNHYAVVEEPHHDGTIWLCKVHSTVETKKRDAKAEEKYRRETREWMWKHRGPRLEAALREIAKGEMNDYAGYAQMVLDDVMKD